MMTVPVQFSTPREVIALSRLGAFPMPTAPVALLVRCSVERERARRGGLWRVVLTGGLVGVFYGDEITVRDGVAA